jgi:alpha-tubulin suppressor-like RCC1 family protein
MLSTRQSRNITMTIAGVAVSAFTFSGAFAAAGLTAASAAPVPGGQGRLPAASSPVTVRGWGTNDDGALGNGGSGSDAPVPVTVQIPAGVKVTSVRAGCDHSVALTSAGTLLAWGDNTFGQVGNGNFKSPVRKPVSVKLPAGTKITAVRAGCEDTIALTKSGSVLAWGQNDTGQLGNGGKKNFATPVTVRIPKGVKIKAITAGCAHNLALATDGPLYAWGSNSVGEIGDGTRTTRRNPVLVKLPGGLTATLTSAGCSDSFAVTSEGLYAWGGNSEGELGTQDGINQHAMPTLVPLLFRGTGPGSITSLFAGCDHTIALFSKGAVLAWGDDFYGQLGNDSNATSLKPVSVQLPSTAKVKAISAGCSDGYALTTTGAVYAWGLDEEGELGDDGGGNSSTPVLVHLPGTIDPTGIGSGPGAEHAFAIASTNPG